MLIGAFHIQASSKMQRQCVLICRYCSSFHTRRLSNSTRELSDKKPLKHQKGRFFDKLRVFARGGSGGHGYLKYGGIGGRGGHVVVRAEKKARFEDLVRVNPKKRYTAATGGNSSRRVLIGVNGEDMIIPVALGVTLKTDEGRKLGDLNEEGQEVIIAYGGTPGGPNNDFIGKQGEAHSVTFDLKLIADIGLVGFPNAGKSTFLSAISRTKPKIAEYPFTTIRPQIGTMQYPDFRQITVADLPGLIEGAHANFGMGHKFLKHVERTKMLLFMVDINGFQLSRQYEHRTAFETVLLLNRELELFNEDMLRKPAVLALNKIDTDEGGERTDELVRLLTGLPDSLSTVDEALHPKKLIRFDEIYKISTMFDLNTKTMKFRLRELLDIYKNMEQGNLDKDTVRENKQIVRQMKVHGREHNKQRIT